jgi:hypothetical protein
MASMKKTAKNDEAPPPSVSAEDLLFEAEIVKRNPGRRIQRYDFPVGVTDARAVYLFELKGTDELLAAEMADANMKPAERKSVSLAFEAERRESIRLSIVGLIDDGNVRRHIDQSMPLMEIDDWSMKGLHALRTFYSDLNGLPAEELGNALKGTRKLGGVTLNANAGQPQAAVATRSDG